MKNENKLVKEKVFRTDENAAYADELLKAILEHDGYSFDAEIRVGDVIKGTLIGKTQKEILIDCGAKSFVMVEGKREEFLALEKMYKQSGDEVEVLVTSVTEEPHQITGSFQGTLKKGIFDEIIEDMDVIVLDGLVKEWTPAGYVMEVSYEGFKFSAFMPNTLAGVNKLADTSALVNQTIEVMIESYAADKGTFIASRKKYLESLIPAQLEKLQNKDAEGNPVLFTGTVTGTTKFGVFVEFNGCLTGMIHKMNLSPEYVQMLENRTINSGDTIQFYVKEVVDTKLFLVQVWRVTLWDTIKEGAIFEVPVKDIKRFGALIQLDSETQGMVHNNELEKRKVTLSVGQMVKVKVDTILRLDRKIYLSLVK